MRQFMLPDTWEAGRTCLLEGSKARYVRSVLRLGIGERFPGMDRDGGRWSCRVVEAGPGRVLLAIEAASPEAGYLPDIRGGRQTRPEGPDSKGKAGPAAGWAAFPPITLVQGLAKGPAMDLVVRQAAEAGVSRIIPLIVSRCQPSARTGRMDRWERIVGEALQQSGSVIPTRIEEPVGIGGLAQRLGPPRGTRLALLLDETPLARSSLREYCSLAPQEIVLCVGPEGGLSPDETSMLARDGFKPLRLPGAVLRTETAALFAVAAVETVFSERSLWLPTTTP